jgi:hypothetical protein
MEAPTTRNFQEAKDAVAQDTHVPPASKLPAEQDPQK